MPYRLNERKYFSFYLKISMVLETLIASLPGTSPPVLGGSFHGPDIADCPLLPEMNGFLRKRLSVSLESPAHPHLLCI